MKIVILSGGTGSIALQQAVYDSIEKLDPAVDVKILTNLYDNGKSTGTVRTVFNGKILGPSDLRKNQTTRLKMTDPESELNNLLDIRFSRSASEAKQYCLDECYNAGYLDVFKQPIEHYFAQPSAHVVDYSDFSLANIIYAGFAALNGNSMRKAGTIMAQIMNIPDNVIVNDDRSMFLGAITECGIRVTDEGDIVSWGNKLDPFVDLFYTLPDGTETQPVLNAESIEALMQADLIILSSGTQWSSLIPTYQSHGFAEVMRETSARIIMVMNRQPDLDSPGQTASDIIEAIIPKYFPKGKVDVLLDQNASPLMNEIVVSGLARQIHVRPMGPVNSTKHLAALLALGLRELYFHGTKADAYVFDYDDTLVGRGNTYKQASAFNSVYFNSIGNNRHVYICTGNSIKAVSTKFRSEIFADAALNLYSDSRELLEHLSPSALFKRDEVTEIMNIIQKYVNNKIENRGNIVIAIKPILPEYRDAIHRLIMTLLKENGYEDLRVTKTGRTTVEISKIIVDKTIAISRLMSRHNSITYVGDEMHDGNDVSVAKLAKVTSKINAVPVKTPIETAYFISHLVDKQYN